MFTPVLAKNLCMGLTLNTYQSPLEKGRLRTKGQQFGQQLQIPGGLEQHSCHFTFSLWDLHKQVREKCLTSCSAKSAHLQSEVRNEKSQGVYVGMLGWNIHTVCPPHHRYITDLQFNLSVPPASHLHRRCSNSALTTLFQLVSSLGQG